MPVRPCSYPGCFTLAKSRYCTQHTKKTNKQGSDRHYKSARWKRLRRLVLARDPVCKACKRAPATDVDHIVPLASGGVDSMENLQGLCNPCHRAKTYMEGGYGKMKRLLYPELPRPNIPVIIVCGCPGAGKTSYAESQRTDDDMLIDLDQIQSKLTGQPIHHSDEELLARALQIRNDMLHSLADRTKGKAYFIVGAPSASERREWKRKLSGIVQAKVIVIETSPDEAERRIRNDPCRAHRIEEMLQWTRDWWQRYAADPFSDDEVIRTWKTHHGVNKGDETASTTHTHH